MGAFGSLLVIGAKTWVGFLELRGTIQEHYEKDFLNGVVVLDVPAKKVVQKNDLYYKVALDGEDTILKMIPYYAWANRDEADMSVWFPKA